MKSKKSVKPTHKDATRHKTIEKRAQAEGVQLDHPQDKERFEGV